MQLQKRLLHGRYIHLVFAVSFFHKRTASAHSSRKTLLKTANVLQEHLLLIDRREPEPLVVHAQCERAFRVGGENARRVRRPAISRLQSEASLLTTWRTFIHFFRPPLSQLSTSVVNEIVWNPHAIAFDVGAKLTSSMIFIR